MLASLSCGANLILDAGARAFANALRNNFALRELEIDRGAIADDGACALAAALHQNSTLQRLDVYENDIGDTGARALADALRCNSTLRKLNLGSNNIGDVGATAFAAALRVNSALQGLSLGYNRIADNGMRELATALISNSTLQDFVIDGDTITFAASYAFWRVIQANTTLLYVRGPSYREFRVRAEEYEQRNRRFHWYREHQSVLNAVPACVRFACECVAAYVTHPPRSVTVPHVRDVAAELHGFEARRRSRRWVTYAADNEAE